MCDKEEKITKVLSDTEKTILTGRIYPAIQSCVRNRYYIIGGIFAYYGFLFSNCKFQKGDNFLWASIVISFIFCCFVYHNLYNYWSNAIDQYELEGCKQKSPTLELWFSTLTLLFIWLAHFYVTQSIESSVICLLTVIILESIIINCLVKKSERKKLDC